VVKFEMGVRQMKEIMNRIEINPKILVGKPIITGTRIPVELIVKLVAQGWKEEDIIKEYPALKKEDIRAALLYAEKIIEEEEVYPILKR
jgi:uncharacterized protein (DUF433 family)